MEIENKVQDVICGLILSKKRLLIVKKGDWWIFPGGKLEEGETHEQCLEREISKEELPGTTWRGEPQLYRVIRGISPTKRKPRIAHLYFIDYKTIGEPNREIEEKAWFARNNINEFNLSDITKKAIATLMEDDYL